MVICLELGANDFHTVQLMPYCRPVISCFVKIQNGLAFLVLAYPVVVEKKLLNGCLRRCT